MEKIYCGNKGLPSGYGRYGTRNECLKCGYGAAMMQYKWSPSSRDARPPRRSKKGCYRPRHPVPEHFVGSRREQSPSSSSYLSARSKSTVRRSSRSPRRSRRRRRSRRQSRRSHRSPRRSRRRHRRSSRRRRSSSRRREINRWIEEEQRRRRRSPSTRS